jgi:polyhydroxybutyrate depolymerase
LRALLCLLCLLWGLAGNSLASPGSTSGSMDVGGVKRSYILHRPSGGSAARMPLVIVLHGGFGTGAQAEHAYGWDQTADANDFLVAYPDGVSRSWNAGACCNPAMKSAVDDVAFIAELVRHLEQAQGVDPQRVFVTGISNGGAMTYRLACEHPFAIAAIGPVAASLVAPCESPAPVSVLAIHGLEDRNIPFQGGPGTKGYTKTRWTPVEASLDPFRKSAACGAASLRTEGEVTHEVSRCTQGRRVELITIAGAGHQWPAPGQKRSLGAVLLDLDPPSQALDATATLWRFFASSPAPAGAP